MFFSVPNDRGALTQEVNFLAGTLFDVPREVTSRRRDVTITVIHMSWVSSVSVVTRPRIRRLVFDFYEDRDFFNPTWRPD